MSLPNNFSSWEHLQNVLINVQNRRVRDEFLDLGEDDWDEEITTPRGSLRTACTLRDSDSALETMLKLYLFDVILKGASNLHPPLYTTPIDLYQQSFRFMPQVTMYFREDLDDVDWQGGYKPLDAEVSFRLANETNETFTPANALTLANKINAEFASASGYRWRKGRTRVTYIDKEKGYNLKIFAYSKIEGREVIGKVLDIQNHTIDNTKLRTSELEQPPSPVPPQQFIYGQSRRLPRQYPIGYVRFRFAECHIWGVSKPIILVDRTLRHGGALVHA